jgi:hypothetical protein
MSGIEEREGAAYAKGFAAGRTSGQLLSQMQSRSHLAQIEESLSRILPFCKNIAEVDVAMQRLYGPLLKDLLNE